MARDPLRVLLRLRGIELDAARRLLADRLRDEAAAAARATGIEVAIARETAVQLSQPAETRATESFAAWLVRVHGAQRDAQAATEACVTATAAARATLNDVRAATRALEAAMARIRDERDGLTARQEQQAVDEAAAGCKRPERWSG